MRLKDGRPACGAGSTHGDDMTPQPRRPAPDPNRSGARARILRPLLVAVAVAFTGAMLVAATLYPTYRAPDEPTHVDLVRAIRQTWHQPDVGERDLSRQIVTSYGLVRFAHGPVAGLPLGASAATARPARPSFDQIAPDEPSGLVNQMPQHPPLYYWLAAGWLAAADHLVPGAFSFETLVYVLRLLGVCLLAGVPWAAARTARRLGLPVAAEAGAAVLALGIPMLIHIGASVNNDTLLVLLGALLLPVIVAVAGGDLRWRRALAGGALLGAALLTKAFALPFVAVVAGAYLVAGRSAGWRRALSRGATALSVAMVVGGWWWVRNVLVYGTIQPSGAPAPHPQPGFAASPAHWLGIFVGRMTRRFWIEPDTVAGSTPVLVVVAALVLAGLLVVGLWQVRRADRLRYALVLGPLVGIVALVGAGAWRAYARTAIPFAIHGRYLYPALVGVLVVAALGAVALAGRRAPLLLLTGGMVLQATAAWWVLVTYWGVDGVVAPLASVRAWFAWAPVPPPIMLAAVVITLAGVGATGWCAWRLARTDDRGQAAVGLAVAPCVPRRSGDQTWSAGSASGLGRS